MITKQLRTATSLLTLLVFGAPFASTATADRPNIIVIMADDMGYGGVSCFDNQYFKTPEIDRLATDGVKLTSFYSNGNLCSPTRAALMTGRYQQRSGCDEVVNADPNEPMHHVGIHDDEWTFPEAMKSVGYTTGILGKWHLGYKDQFNPTLHGFDEFKGFVSGNIDAHSHRDRMGVADWWDGTELKDEPGYHTDVITQNAVDFIDRHQDKPFFLYVAHGTPHSPHQARGSLIQRGPDKGKRANWAPEEEYNKTPGDEDWLIRHFMIPLDESVAQIRSKVEELGIEENTIIWFISDNGGTKGNHSLSSQTRGGKVDFFEGGIRVPGIVWAPGRITSGTVSEETILTFDIMPTSMALANATAPIGHVIDGIDVSPALFDNEKLPSKTRFWSMWNGGALREGPWKLVVLAEQKLLFNLDDDPQETKDLTATFPERVSEMSKTYQKMLKETKADSPYPTLPVRQFYK